MRQINFDEGIRLVQVTKVEKQKFIVYDENKKKNLKTQLEERLDLVKKLGKRKVMKQLDSRKEQ